MESRQTIIRFLSGKYEDITSGIYSGSSQLIEILDDGEQLDFKGCNANSFEAKIANLTDKLIVGEKISVCQKIGTEEVQLFTGIIDTAELQTDKTYRKVVAYDELYSKTAVNITSWYNNFFTRKSNVTLKNFRDELFAYIGIEQVETTLINDEMIVNQTASGVIKFGDMVANICEINGVFGNINRYGKFEYVDLNNTAEIDITENLRSNGKVQDYEVMQISSVELYTDKDSNYCIAGSGNSFIVNGNSLLYEKTYSELQKIAENLLTKVKEITYTPVDINTIVTDLDIVPGTKIIFTTHSGKNIFTYAMRNKLSDTQMFKQNIIANGDKTRSETVNNTNSELDVLQKAMIMKLDAYEATLTYATITSLEAIDAEVQGKLNVNELEGKVAAFGYLTVDTANLLYASIPELDSVKADIDEVNSLITNTNTLIFGSASGGTIQTSFSNSVIAQLGDAQIESAMIKEISAAKITGLDLNTTKLTIHSEDGLSQWQDNTITMYDGVLGTPRIQIGKDGSGDYNVYIWNAQGKLMFDALGLTENGITRQIIRNDVVKDDANINAAKLNLESLFGVINDDTSYTLKSSKIYIDEEGQTLDVSFKVMSSNIDDLQSTQTNQGTSIETIQGQITSKIWQQDITTAIGEIEGGRNLQKGTQNWTDLVRVQSGATIKGEILTIPQNIYVDCNFIEVSKGEKITISVDAKCDVATSNGILIAQWYSQPIFDEYSTNRLSWEWIQKDISTEWVRYSATLTVPSDIEVTHLLVGLRSRDAGNMYFKHLKVERGTKATNWTSAPEDVDSNITTLSTKYSSLEQDVGTFKTTVSETYTTIEDFNNLQIGGVNLISDTQYWDFVVNASYKNKEELNIPYGVSDVNTPLIEIIENKEYSVSVDIKSTSEYTNNTFVILYYDETQTRISYEWVVGKIGAKWTRVSKTFTTPASCKYVAIGLRSNPYVNTYRHLMLEEGIKVTTWSPNPNDYQVQIEFNKSVATQTSEMMDWLVASGTSSTNFTLTDRMAELTAQIISLNGNVKVSGDMLIDGAITADKLATDAIMSRNYIADTSGSYLDLEDGSFKSKSLSWDKYGNFNARSGYLGKWSILTGGGLMAETDTGTAPGTLNRVYLQPFNNTDYEETWVISSQHEEIDSAGEPKGESWPYWYITGGGDIYTDGFIYASSYIYSEEYIQAPIIYADNAYIYGKTEIHGNGLELYYTTPYIDFHYNNSTDDHTARIVENSKGALTVYNTISNASDRRLKQDICELDERYLNVLNSLKPVSYRFIKGSDNLNIGFIAQPVEEILINCGINDLPIVSKSNDGIYALDYNQITALNTLGHLDHEKRIQQLENDLAVANAIIQSLLLSSV